MHQKRACFRGLTGPWHRGIMAFGQGGRVVICATIENLKLTNLKETKMKILAEISPWFDLIVVAVSTVIEVVVPVVVPIIENLIEKRGE